MVKFATLPQYLLSLGAFQTWEELADQYTHFDMTLTFPEFKLTPSVCVAM